MLGKDIGKETAKSRPSSVQNLLSHVSPDQESWSKVYGESGQESEAGPGQKSGNVRRSKICSTPDKKLNTHFP